MQIDDRIAGLSDQQLDALHQNAARLAQTGKALQQQEAERLLPLIAAEKEERRQARAAQLLQNRRQAGKTKSKAKDLA